MVDPSSSPEAQAILQQAGVSYDVVLFYVSSNLVGKRVREPPFWCSPSTCWRWWQTTDEGSRSAPHSVHRVYDT
jgi:hypothetical protein